MTIQSCRKEMMFQNGRQIEGRCNSATNEVGQSLSLEEIGASLFHYSVATQLRNQNCIGGLSFLSQFALPTKPS